jgi:hypothetical protein
MEVNGPNETARKKLAEEWKLLSSTDQIRLRAIRAKRGISCSLCGAVGYYRENCPSKCNFRPDSPDSMDSTPPVSPREIPAPVGILWGEMGFGPRQDEKPNLDTLRPQMTTEKKKLIDSDKHLLSHEFMSHADSGYYRNNAELNLHQVMRNMMRVTERLLRQNAATLSDKSDKTLLVPPVTMPGSTFYPESLSKEYKQYREYYYAKLAKEGRKTKAHMFKGNTRSSDALDGIFRGGGGQEHKLYEVDPEAAKSVHSILGWKNILSTSDNLASSDPDQVAKDAKVKALFRQQGEWTRLQKTAMEYKNDRFDHFVTVLRQELEEEHKREATILLTENKREEQQRRAEGFLKQLEAVDRILKTSEEYSFTAGTEEMDYLLFQLKTWKEANAKGGVRRRAQRRDLRDQYEQSGLPVPKKLYKTTNRDKAAGFGPDGNVSEAVLAQRRAVALAARMAGKSVEDEDAYTAVDSTSSSKRSRHDNGLQVTVPAHPRPKKPTKKLGGGTGLAAAVGGVSPYEMTEVDIIVHKRPGQKEKEKEVRQAERQRKKEEKEYLQKVEMERARTATTTQSDSGDDNSSQGSMGSADSGSRYSRSAAGSGGGGGTVSSFGTDSQLGDTGMPRGPSAFEMTASRNAINFKEWDRKDADKTTARAYKKARKVRKKEMAMKEQARRHAEARGEFDRAKEAKKNKFASKALGLNYQPTADEVDAMEMKEITRAFEEAGMGTHIRDGGYEQANLHKMPALIPVPLTFNDPGDPELRLKSYAAEKAMDDTRLKMRDKMSGRIKTQLLPLYVRNTLIEHNGTSEEGDQTQDVLQKDRRYNHTWGRSVAVFENTKGGPLSVAERERRKLAAAGLLPKKKPKVKALTDKEKLVTGSLINLAFKNQSTSQDF